MSIPLVHGLNFWPLPQVALIGMGMAREDLGANALQWIERAEILVGGVRHLESFPEHPGRKIALKAPLEAVLDEIDRFSRHYRVALLASGDPFFYGIGRRLVERLGNDRVFALPNVTSVQVLFARLGQSWQDAKIVSLHGRGASGESAWLREFRSHTPLVLFTDPIHSPNWIARRMCEAGVAGRVLLVGEDLGLPSERVRSFSPEEAAEASFSPLNLVAVLPAGGSGEGRGVAESACRGPVLGLPEAAFRHEAGLITKMEVRAVALALLQLEPGLVLWDLGAASGSVSIEAARMVPLGQVIAVEKNENRFRDLVENIRRFSCHEIEAVRGSASEVLERLPDPDRVFIGGSGKDLADILDRAAARLRPSGRLVQTVVTLDSFETARTFWRDKPFELSVTQLQVNRSVPIGGSSRLESLNPVFILTAWRKN